jgi:predicted transposase/invertase (TIGR01784 family)
MSDINPRVDLAFKKIFGVEENKDLLISLINSIVSTEDQVRDVTILNPYNPQNFKNDKLSILDIKAEGETGKRFNIEIQISDEADYDKRALYYWAKLYTEQLHATKNYGALNKAIGIHILNFTSIPNEEKYHNVFKIKEKDSNIEYYQDLELHTIELNKFMNEVGDELSSIMARVKNKIDIWSAFLTKYDVLNNNVLEGELNDPNLKKALDVLNIMNFTPAEREEYESHLKWLRIEAGTVKKAEDKAREEGLEKGREEEKIEIATNMLKQDLDLKLISDVTKLTEDKIKTLQDSLKK